MQCNNSCNNSCLIQHPEYRRSSWLPNIDVTELFHFLYKYGQEIGARGWYFDRDIREETVTLLESFLIKGVGNCQFCYVVDFVEPSTSSTFEGQGPPSYRVACSIRCFSLSCFLLVWNFSVMHS